MPHRTQAKEIMNKKIITVTVGSSLAEATSLMSEYRVRHLPVRTLDNRVVGILSSKDFSNIVDPQNTPVEGLMSGPVEWVESDLPLRSAILRMIEKKISCLLIGDSRGDIKGVITSEDLLWFLAEMLEKNEHKQSPFTLFDVQSLSEVANQISFTGL